MGWSWALQTWTCVTSWWRAGSGIVLVQEVWCKGYQTGHCLGETWSQMEPLMKEGLREGRYHLDDNIWRNRGHDKEIIKYNSRFFLLLVDCFTLNYHKWHSLQFVCKLRLSKIMWLLYYVARRGSHWTITHPTPPHRCVNLKDLMNMEDRHIRSISFSVFRLILFQQVESNIWNVITETITVTKIQPNNHLKNKIPILTEYNFSFFIVFI